MLNLHPPAFLPCQSSSIYSFSACTSRTNHETTTDCEDTPARFTVFCGSASTTLYPDVRRNRPTQKLGWIFAEWDPKHVFPGLVGSKLGNLSSVGPSKTHPLGTLSYTSVSRGYAIRIQQESEDRMLESTILGDRSSVNTKTINGALEFYMR